MKLKNFQLLFLASFLMMTTALAQDSVRVAPAPKTSGKFFLSTDQGTTWIAADSGFPTDEVVTAWVHHGDQLIAGTSRHGIYFFDAKSKSWSASSAGLPDRAEIRAMVKVGDAILASEAIHGLYVSFNGGQHWERTTGPENIMVSLTNVSATQYQRQRVRCLFAANNAIYAGTDDGIFKAESIGKSWNLIGSGIQVNDFNFFRGSLFAATNRGIFRSTDGNSWEVVMSGKAVSRLTLTEKEIAGTSFGQGIVISDQQGDSWSTVLPLLESQYTFQITPTSAKILIEPWMRGLPFLNSGRRLRMSALPKNAPLSRMIPLTGAILIIDASNDGC